MPEPVRPTSATLALPGISIVSCRSASGKCGRYRSDTPESSSLPDSGHCGAGVCEPSVSCVSWAYSTQRSTDTKFTSRSACPQPTPALRMRKDEGKRAATYEVADEPVDLLWELQRVGEREAGLSTTMSLPS